MLCFKKKKKHDSESELNKLFMNHYITDMRKLISELTSNRDTVFIMTPKRYEDTPKWLEQKTIIKYIADRLKDIKCNAIVVENSIVISLDERISYLI